jgi:CO/xanthine dehydrogenase FAD-binding subunit
MTPLEYLLPETIEDALKYLERGVALAGGTGLTPRRNELKAMVDLRNLNLDRIEMKGDFIEIGATTTLQQIVEAELDLPDRFRDVCKLESGWNLRNMATIGGAIMSSDGRSAILTTLLALDAQIEQQPGPITLTIDDVLDHLEGVKLITKIRFRKPSKLLYEQVSRAPADFPLVCAAIATWDHEGEERCAISLGGYGARPLRLREADTLFDRKRDISAAVEFARKAYGHAGDQWASADYRSDVVGILVDRLLREVAS